jgi:hypothetical protein
MKVQVAVEHYQLQQQTHLAELRQNMRDPATLYDPEKQQLLIKDQYPTGEHWQSNASPIAKIYGDRWIWCDNALVKKLRASGEYKEIDEWIKSELLLSPSSKYKRYDVTQMMALVYNELKASIVGYHMGFDDDPSYVYAVVS